MEGLRSDIQWLAQTNNASWGNNFEQVFQNWEEQKQGWKSFVKKAEMKHAVHEGIDYFLHFDMGAKENCAIEEEELPRVCWCGDAVGSKRALATHAHRKHGEFTPEHGRVHGIVCPGCNKQMSSNARLKQHLRYQYKKNMNRCWAFVLASNWRDHPDDGQSELPMVGMKRTEAVVCEGPLCFGTLEDHEVYVEKRFAEVETELQQKNISNPFSFYDEDIKQVFLTAMQDEEDGWFATIANHGEHLISEVFCINLIFAGAQIQWKSRSEQGLWASLVQDCEFGTILAEWFDLSLRKAFLDRMDEVKAAREESQQDSIPIPAGQASTRSGTA